MVSYHQAQRPTQAGRIFRDPLDRGGGTAAHGLFPRVRRAGCLGPGPSAAIDRSSNSAVSRQKTTFGISIATEPRGPSKPIRTRRRPGTSVRVAACARKRSVSLPAWSTAVALPIGRMASCGSLSMESRPTRESRSPHIHVSKPGGKQGPVGFIPLTPGTQRGEPEPGQPPCGAPEEEGATWLRPAAAGAPWPPRGDMWAKLRGNQDGRTRNEKAARWTRQRDGGCVWYSPSVSSRTACRRLALQTQALRRAKI